MYYQFYFINVAFLIPTTSSHYFCIRLGNQEYSRSQLPSKMEKLEDWTKQPKTSCLLFFALDCTMADKKFRPQLHSTHICCKAAFRNE
jgi:hypothetical protein